MLAVDARARAAYDCVAALVDREYRAKKRMRALDDGDDAVEDAVGVDITRKDVTTKSAVDADDTDDADDDERAKKITALFKAMLTARAVREDSTPVEVTPGVYVGSVGAAKNVDSLRALGVTHVLCVCNGMPAGGFAPRGTFVHRSIEIRDSVDADIAEHFETTREFIRDALARGGRVLVHCFQGRSRSVAVCAVFMMCERGMTLEEAMTAIRAVRPRAMPNSGFMRALEALDARLRA
jgi:hypothetical protein